MISLLEVIKVPTNSGRTWAMERFVTNKLKEMNVEFETDTLGNIYKLIPNTPIISSHMDSVGSTDDIAALQYAERINGNIVGFGNLGADDKVGVWICLNIIQKLKNKVSFVFSVDEEKWGIGIKAFVNSYGNTIKNDILYALVFDRMGSSDIIGINNDYCTRRFQNKIEKLLEKYNYSSATGSFSDADSLSDYISTVNLSVGYYKPHSKDEYIVIKDAKKALYAGLEIVENLNEKFPAYNKIRKVFVSKRYKGFSKYDNWQDEWERDSIRDYLYKGLDEKDKDEDEEFETFDEVFEEITSEIYYNEINNPKYWERFREISNKYKASIYIMPPEDSGVIKIRNIVSEKTFKRKKEIIDEYDDIKKSIRDNTSLPVEIIVQKDINVKNKNYEIEALDIYHPIDKIKIEEKDKDKEIEKEITAQLNAAALKLFTPKSKDDLSLQDISETFDARIYVSTEYNEENQDGIMHIRVTKNEINKDDSCIVQSINQYLDRVMPTQLKIDKVKGIKRINLRKSVELLLTDNDTVKTRPWVLALFPKKDIKALNKGGEIN